jgi:predicted NAD/FAD-binding protein
MKRVAVIGAGISGLAAAYFLSRRHEVHLFERGRRLGGHTHTIVASSSGGPVPLDTGFLVHNDRTYPRLVRLFAELEVETQPSDMCFGVTCRRTGLEYSSRGARGFFAQPSNLLRRAHFGLLRDILRFNREAPRLIDRPGAERVTVADFLESRRFSEPFVWHYLMPMASAIWSASLDGIRQFPALTLIRFLDNHGLLALSGQPRWKVVRGGSHSYVPKLTAPLARRVHHGTSLAGVTRAGDGVTLRFVDRPPLRFDDVVFACHGDQVLPLLTDPSDRERDVFASFATTENVAWLHTDERVLPRREAARASWNYQLASRDEPTPTVTYHLNRLQSLATREQFCVTLNPRDGLDERRVLRRLVYRHPLYTRQAIRAQSRWAEVSGVNRTHYCGAYWFYGFHEDGVRSALRVASALGVDW